MNKLALISSSVFTGILGIVLSFLPQEVLHFHNEPANMVGVLAIKLLGTCLIALASVNWLSRARLIGGIYNRPLALANALHFSIGAVILIKTIIVTFFLSLFVLSFLYSVFGVAFLKIMFTTPNQVTSNSEA